MVYQEQVMRILNRLGGIELSDAYKCIKAISKKKLPTIAKFQEQFIEGATAQGFSRKESIDLFGLIEKFAGYGFNKSHSTAYALIAYQTAYLKAHYPAEFMAALLTGDIPGRNFKSKDALIEHLEDCRRMNIEVVPPDVNRSGVRFEVEKSDDGNHRIHFALSAIKSCGGGAAESIVKERIANGPFANLFDFCERVDAKLVNRSTIETLIKAGAFDSTGARRSQLAAVLDRALQSGATALADRRRGQANMFDDLDDDDQAANVALPDIPEWDERQRMSGEKEVLGYYLSSHPLAEHEKTLASFCTHTTADLPSVEHRAEVIIGGILSALKFSHTKNPRPGQTQTKYVMFDLEDMQGIVRCILWPEQFAAFGELVKPDAILVVNGAVDRRPGSEETNLIVNELIPPEQMAQRCTTGVRILLDEQQHGESGVQQLYEILRRYPGNCGVELIFSLGDGTRVRCECDDVRVTIDEEMKNRVADLLGAGSLRPITVTPQVAKAPSSGRRQFAGSRG
jgi:DNA polymerase-3 subunit alpha